MEQIKKKFVENDALRHENQRVMSLVEEAETKSIRMANLCVVASHAVNGVAELHT
jgi:starch phosphorylase